MTAPSEVALTDDEIAALSRRLGGRWRAVLPSLDPSDPAGLGRAVVRGERSLLARGLMAAGEEGVDLDAALANLASLALTGEVAVSAYTADTELTFDPKGFTYLNYTEADSDDVLVEVVDAIGLHRFGLLTRTEAAEALTALTEALHLNEEPAAGQASGTLCLAFPASSAGQRTVFTLSPGTVETAVIEPAKLDELNRTNMPLRHTTMAVLAAVIERTYVR